MKEKKCVSILLTDGEILELNDGEQVFSSRGDLYEVKKGFLCSKFHVLSKSEVIINQLPLYYHKFINDG